MGTAIKNRYVKAIKQAKKENQPLLVLDIPLLFEAGYESLVDEVMLVYLKPELQLKRLMERDTLNKQEAQKRIANQWPIDKKVSLSDIILNSEGTTQQTRQQAKEWLVKKGFVE